MGKIKFKDSLISGNKRNIKYCLDKDVNRYINKKYTSFKCCGNRVTPLMIACYYNHLNLVTMLLEYPEIDINYVNKQGYSALSIALNKWSHTNLPDLLIKAGANLCIKLPNDYPDLLSMVCINGYFSILKSIPILEN